jgi:hypothetical protein
MSSDQRKRPSHTLKNPLLVRGKLTTNLYAMTKDTNYENFIAECPYCDCKNENIFNRVSDLKTTKPISSMEVKCLKCKRKFRITSDLVSEKHQYLIYDCYELLKQKRYMYCVINLCIACEAFFLKGIEVKLLWEPWKQKLFQRDTEIFNHYSDKLYKKTHDYTYSKLLNVFFDLYLKNRSFHSQMSIDDYMNVIDCFAKIEPKDEDMQKYHDPETRDLFMRLKKLKINEMRNKVAHKYAFRPTLQDAKKYHKEVESIIFSLQTRLKIKHETAYFN